MIVLQIIGFIIIIYVTYKRRTIVNDFLTVLMNSKQAQSINLMDTIQNYVSFVHPVKKKIYQEIRLSKILLNDDRQMSQLDNFEQI